jgi:hypothetical protein
LSVDALHERSIWLGDTAVAVSPVGTVGAVVSPPPPETRAPVTLVEPEQVLPAPLHVHSQVPLKLRPSAATLRVIDVIEVVPPASG